MEKGTVAQGDRSTIIPGLPYFYGLYVESSALNAEIPVPPALEKRCAGSLARYPAALGKYPLDQLQDYLPSALAASNSNYGKTVRPARSHLVWEEPIGQGALPHIRYFRSLPEKQGSSPPGDSLEYLPVKTSPSPGPLAPTVCEWKVAGASSAHCAGSSGCCDRLFSFTIPPPIPTVPFTCSKYNTVYAKQQCEYD